MVPLSGPGWIYISILSLFALAALGARLLTSHRPSLKSLGKGLVSVGLLVEGSLFVVQKSKNACEGLGTLCEVVVPSKTPPQPPPQHPRVAEAPNATPPLVAEKSVEAKPASKSLDAKAEEKRTAPAGAKTGAKTAAAQPVVEPPAQDGALTKASTTTARTEGRRDAKPPSIAVATHVENKVFVTVVTSPDAAAGPKEPPPKPALVQGIKRELKRLGCYGGEVEGGWTKEARNAADRFNTYGHRKIADIPDDDSLAVLRGFSERVCP